MSLQASQSVHITNSQETLNSQVFERSEISSDISMDDFPSDLPDITIENLLNLDKPPAVVHTIEDDHSPDLDLFGDDEDLLKAINEDPSWAIVSQVTPTHEIKITESIQQLKSQPITIDKEDSPVKEWMDCSDLPEIFDSTEASPEKHNQPDLNSIIEDISFDSDSNEGKEGPSKSVTIPLDDLSEKMQITDIKDESPEASTEQPSPQPAPPRFPSELNQKKLRARKEVQVKPFTVEASHYNELIKGTSVKASMKDPVDTDDADSDTDFTPSNTQAVDESIDDISTYQDTQFSIYEPASTKIISKLKKKDTISEKAKGKGKAKQGSANTLEIASSTRPLASLTSISTDLPSTYRSINDNNAESDLTKYGLNKLILPPSKKSKDKGKGKLIAFSAKKKGSSKKPNSAKRIPSRFVDNTSKDIFAFDFSPRPIFDLQPELTLGLESKSSQLNDISLLPVNEVAPSSPVNNMNDMDDMDDPIEFYESPPKSLVPATTSVITIDGQGDKGMDEEYDDSEMPVFKRLRRKRKRMTILDSDDEEDHSSEKGNDETQMTTQTSEDTDSIFDFPSGSPAPLRRHLRVIAEDDIVPVVEDEFEYKEPKRQRLSIKDLKKKTLKNILPASFFKVNQRKIEEEERLRKKKMREAKAAKKAHPSSMRASASSSTITFLSKGKHRDTEEVFASFRNDSEPSEDEFGNDNGFDNNIDYDYDYQETNPPSSIFDDFPNASYKIKSKSQAPVAPIFQQHNRAESSTAQSNHSSTRALSHNIPTKKSTYPLEATEDNRIAKQILRSNNNINYNNNSNKGNIRNVRTQSKRETSSSSATGKKSLNTRSPIPNSNQLQQNIVPARRKRKPKRTRDDIQIHSPYYRSYGTSPGGNTNNLFAADIPDNFNNFSNDQGNDRHIIDINNQHDNNANPGSRNQGMFVNDKLQRRPFDDIYLNTKRQMWYKKDLIYIGNYDISDYLHQPVTLVKPQQPIPVIYTLEYATEKIAHFMDYDVRRVVGLRDTVYWHHQLLQPLLSNTPNKASTYIKFEKTYSSLKLFGKEYFWKDINPQQTRLINTFFSKVSGDLLHMCENDKYNPQPDMKAELPGHDHFYVFVSICLTQWIPYFPNESKLELVKIFGDQVFSLATIVPHLIKGRPFEALPLRSLVKLMLFVLDWTCRLHHLGLDEKSWSVKECIQLLIDLLVYIGYESILGRTTESYDYVSEAWICIMQILSVSIRHRVYKYDNENFIKQFTGSIKARSRIKEVEYGKRKTTRLWAESLAIIMKKHMLLL